MKKFKEKACGNCGLDLTDVEPVGVVEMPLDGEIVFLAECPGCPTNRIVVEPEPEPEPTPDTGPEPEPEPEPEAEPEPETEPEE